MLDDHPSVTFDLAPGLEGYLLLSKDSQSAREFFISCQDRLIYGTDMGAGQLLDLSYSSTLSVGVAAAWMVRAFLETDWDLAMPGGLGKLVDLFAGQHVRGIALPRGVLEKIYFRNFERFDGPSPRPLP